MWFYFLVTTLPLALPPYLSFISQFPSVYLTIYSDTTQWDRFKAETMSVNLHIYIYVHTHTHTHTHTYIF